MSSTNVLIKIGNRIINVATISMIEFSADKVFVLRNGSNHADIYSDQSATILKDYFSGTIPDSAKITSIPGATIVDLTCQLKTAKT